MPRKTKETELENKKKIVEEEKITPKPKKSPRASSSRKAKSSSKQKATSSVGKKEVTKSTVKSTKSAKASSSKTTTKVKTTAKAKKQPAPKIDVVEYYDLPYRYNQTVVKVLAQTPNHLFIYWDISDEDRKRFEKLYGSNFFTVTRPVLLVHNDTLHYCFEIPINDFANSWYLHVNDSKCDYRIELGRKPIEPVYEIQVDEEEKEVVSSQPVDYIYVSSSNQIESPNDHILMEKKQEVIHFRNVKTNQQITKPVTDFPFVQLRQNDPTDAIFDFYRAFYHAQDIQEIYDLKNPSSGGNPSSGNPSSHFK